MRRDIGSHGLKLIKSFESFVGFVYDDFGPLPYREWKGGHARGTLTIGYGHTNAARNPLKISEGLRVTEAQAVEILHDDLGECVEAVNKMVKVPLTQGQFDALVSFTFNCGAGNTRRLVAPLSRGDYEGTRANFSRYIRSKGQVMRGLERRRHAEQLLWDDRYEEMHGRLPADTEETITPKDVDGAPERKTPFSTHGTAIAVGGAGAVEGLDTVNSTLATVRETHDSLTTTLAAITMEPSLWIAVAIVAGAAFLWWQHREKNA